MLRRSLSVTIWLLVLAPTLGRSEEKDPVGPVAVVALSRTERVSFEGDILPIFRAKCFVCHSGPVNEGGLNLATHAALLSGGKRGAAVVAGKSAESLLVKLVGRTTGPAMPPAGEELPVTPQELALVKLWIDQGAKGEPQAASNPAVTLRPLPEHLKWVRALALSADKSLLAVGRAGEIHLYRVETGEHVRALVDPALAAAGSRERAAAHVSLVESLAFSPDGASLASGSFGELAVWDVAAGSLRYRISGFADRVVGLDFSRDGKWIAACGGVPTLEGEIKLVEVASGKVAEEYRGLHSDTVYAVAFNPAGTMLATAGADQTVKVIEVPGGKLLKTFQGHTHHVLDVAWNAPGTLLASAGADKTVKLWDYEAGEQVTKLGRNMSPDNEPMNLDHPNQVSRVRFLASDWEVLSLAGNQPVGWWKIEEVSRDSADKKQVYRGHTGRTIRTFGDGSDYLYALAASADGAVIAVGGESGAVHLYKGSDGSLLQTLSSDAGNAP